MAGEPDDERFSETETIVDPPRYDVEVPERTAAQIEALVADHFDLVGRVARSVGRQLGGLIERDELEALGRAGLFEAARGYSEERCPFPAYARRKMRWAMFDGVRRETHGRSVAVRATALFASERVAAIYAEPAPDPSAPESAHLSRMRHVLATSATAMAVAFVSNSGEEIADPKTGSSPEESVGRAELSQQMRELVAELEPRLREIVVRHYFEGERFDHISTSLGVSKSWVSRLHAQAIDVLLSKLRARP